MPSRSNFGGPPKAGQFQGGYGYGQGFNTVGQPGGLPPTAMQGGQWGNQLGRGPLMGGQWGGGGQDAFSGFMGNPAMDRQANLPPGQEPSATITNEELMGLARQDWATQQGNLDANWQQNKDFQDEFRSFIEGMPGAVEEDQDRLLATADEEAARIRRTTGAGHAEAKRMAAETLSKVEEYNQQAISRAEQALTDLRDMTAEQVSAASYGMQHNYEQQRTQILSNPNMTDSQKRDQMNLVDQQRRGELQATATAANTQHNNLATQTAMSIANTITQASATYAGAAGQQHGIVDQARARRDAGAQAAGSMRTAAANQVLASTQQMQQFQMGGYQALGQFTASNPRMSASMLPVGMLMNYLQTSQPGMSAEAGWGEQNGQMSGTGFAGGGTDPFGNNIKSSQVRREMSRREGMRFQTMDHLEALIHPMKPGPSGMMNPYTGELTRAQAQYNRNFKGLQTRYS